MLKKQNRLLRFSFKTKSQNLDTSLFKIKIFSSGSKVNKFGFVVSKKIDTKAVIRNKTKRVLKKAVKTMLGKIKVGKDIIIIAKEKLDFKQEALVEKTLNEVFKKAGILK